MSTEPVLITLASESGAGSSLPVVLKKIMEMPPPNILDGDDGEYRYKTSSTGEGRKRTRNMV